MLSNLVPGIKPQNSKFNTPLIIHSVVIKFLLVNNISNPIFKAFNSYEWKIFSFILLIYRIAA